MLASHTAETLMGTFRLTDYLVPMALEDVTDEDARRRSRGDEGPSIAWLVGHMLHYRCHVMGLLGVDRPDPWKERFADTEATDGSGYPTVAELREAWDAVADEFAAAMASKTDADFERPVEGPHDEQTLRDQLVFYAWHEGYHMGALGAQLKQLGYLGPAEKVMASRLAKFDG